MDRAEILQEIIDTRHQMFKPSEKYLYYYASLTDKGIMKELELVRADNIRQ